MVDGGHGGNAAADGPEPVGKGLVVVDDVETPAVALNEIQSPPAEGERFGKSHGRYPQPLDEVQGLAQFRQAGDPERIGRIVEIETGEPVDPDVRIEPGIGRSGNHLHPVAQIDQGPAQVLQVDPLATAVGVAAVAEQADGKRASGTAPGPWWCRWYHGHGSRVSRK